MNTETMSVHRALAELKMIDSKTTKEISNAKFAGAKKVKGKTVDGITSEDFRQRSNASLQSVLGLIKRRTAIKSALVLSNARTEVEVAGETMTVAEAIDRKNVIQTQISLIDKLKVTYRKVHQNVIAHNEQLNNDALLYFQQITENKEKLNENAFKALVGAYKEEREQEVVEGFDVYKMQDKLDNQLQEFLSNVDYVLSESNTETKITIEY